MSHALPVRSLRPASRLFAIFVTFAVAALLLAVTSPSAHADATVTGKVTTGAGTGIDRAKVTACPWDGDTASFDCDSDGGGAAAFRVGRQTAMAFGVEIGQSAMTAADGSFSIDVAPGTTYALFASKATYAPRFLGGSGSIPLTVTAENSFSAAEGQTLTGKDIVLEPRETALGDEAGIDQPWCTANALGPGEHSKEIDLPFAMDFYDLDDGNTDAVYLLEDGRVSFNTDYVDPEDSLATTDVPQIAVFGAAVDTSDVFGSNQVTWGVSPDEKQVCITWAGVKRLTPAGESDDLVNTFQLLLTDRSGVDGRPAGDFDITFNYDKIEWDAAVVDADQPDETIPAIAGFSNGTGVPNTFLELPGSGVAGALNDEGTNALIDGSHNTATAGRYIYEIRNDDFTYTPWTVSGDVTYPDGGGPVEGTWVTAYMVGHESRNFMARTDSEGHYSISGVSPGTYVVRAFSPNSNYKSAQSEITLAGGDDETLNYELQLNKGVPPGVAMSTSMFGSAGEGAHPTINWHDAIKLRVESDECLTQVKYAFRGRDGQVIDGRQGFLDPVLDPDDPPPPYVFEKKIAPVAPAHGYASIELIKIPCEGPEIPQEFGVYIDPSGVVVDQWGLPAEGATVTLKRADASEGPYAVVPDGSDTMDPSNRENPTTTGAGGNFGWDVISGWYLVTATKPGYVQGQSALMQVAPERLGLFVKLGGGTAPAYSSTLAGSPAVGQTLSLSGPAGVPDVLEPVAYEWSRDGATIPGASGASYTLTADDAGHSVAGAVVLRRDDVVEDAAAKPQVNVSFTPVKAWSQGVAVPALPAEEPAATPKLVKSKKKINYRKQITVKFSCPEGCVLTLGLKIGKGKVKTFKTITLKPGTKQYKFKLPKKYVRQLQKAFKKSKNTKAVLQAKISNVLKTKHDTVKNTIQNAR